MGKHIFIKRKRGFHRKVESYRITLRKCHVEGIVNIIEKDGK